MREYIDPVGLTRAEMPARSSARKGAVPSKPESLKAVADRMEERVHLEAPSLKIEQHWGHPWFVGTDLVCLVGHFSHDAAIEFWRGSMIPDPDHLLEGTGKNLRHVKLRTLEEASSPQLAALLHRAVELDRTEPKRTR